MACGETGPRSRKMMDCRGRTRMVGRVSSWLTHTGRVGKEGHRRSMEPGKGKGRGREMDGVAR